MGRVNYIRHGLNKTPEYRAWQSMKARCQAYFKDSKNYFHRGIKVCAEWKHCFPVFLAHVGNMPAPGMWLDRIDNNGNYEPGNVRWATPTQQLRNSRHNHHVTINGQTKLLVDWSKESGISVTTLIYRLREKWPDSRLLSAPWTAKRRRSCA